LFENCNEAPSDICRQYAEVLSAKSDVTHLQLALPEKYIRIIIYLWFCLIPLSAVQTIYRKSTEWLVNNELERMWKEVVVA
jgi:hypothetical protein